MIDKLFSINDIKLMDHVYVGDTKHKQIYSGFVYSISLCKLTHNVKISVRYLKNNYYRYCNFYISNFEFFDVPIYFVKKRNKQLVVNKDFIELDAIN